MKLKFWVILMKKVLLFSIIAMLLCSCDKEQLLMNLWYLGSGSMVINDKSVKVVAYGPDVCRESYVYYSDSSYIFGQNLISTNSDKKGRKAAIYIQYAGPSAPEIGKEYYIDYNTEELERWSPSYGNYLDIDVWYYPYASEVCDTSVLCTNEDYITRTNSAKPDKIRISFHARKVNGFIRFDNIESLDMKNSFYRQNISYYFDITATVESQCPLTEPITIHLKGNFEGKFEPENYGNVLLSGFMDRVYYSEDAFYCKE
jgi:hypothetical protein